MSNQQVEVARTNSRTAIIVAIIGAVVSIVTVLKDVIVPKAKETYVTEVAEQINTDVEEKINVNVTEKINDRLKSQGKGIMIDLIPIGTIIPSSLNFEQLSIEVGQPKPSSFSSASIGRYTWIPADGRNVAGSKYDKISPRVPELRGAFIRGLNEFDPAYGTPVPDGKKDQEGDKRTVGDFQDDAFKLHDHNVSNSGLTFTDGDWTVIATDKNSDQNNLISRRPMRQVGGTETRPKNRAVYYYIKIN